MGIVCDTSVLIAAEKRRFDLAAFLRAHPDDLATLNLAEFRRVPRLKLVDTGRFMLTR